MLQIRDYEIQHTFQDNVFWAAKIPIWLSESVKVMYGVLTDINYILQDGRDIDDSGIAEDKII